MTRGGLLDRLLVRPLPGEVAATRPGDDIVPAPDVVMDRGFDLPAPPVACGRGSRSSAGRGRGGTCHAGSRW